MGRTRSWTTTGPTRESSTGTSKTIKVASGGTSSTDIGGPVTAGRKVWITDMLGSSRISIVQRTWGKMEILLYGVEVQQTNLCHLPELKRAVCSQFRSSILELLQKKKKVKRIGFYGTLLTPRLLLIVHCRSIDLLFGLSSRFQKIQYFFTAQIVRKVLTTFCGRSVLNSFRHLLKKCHFYFPAALFTSLLRFTVTYHRLVPFQRRFHRHFL